MVFDIVIHVGYDFNPGLAAAKRHRIDNLVWL